MKVAKAEDAKNPAKYTPLKLTPRVTGKLTTEDVSPKNPLTATDADGTMRKTAGTGLKGEKEKPRIIVIDASVYKPPFEQSNQGTIVRVEK